MLAVGGADAVAALLAAAEALGAHEAGEAVASVMMALPASSLAKLLRTIEVQLALYRQRIETLFAQHPGHDLFGSLPAVGAKLAPRLLAEIGEDRDRKRCWNDR